MFLRANRAGCLTCVLESFFVLFLCIKAKMEGEREPGWHGYMT